MSGSLEDLRAEAAELAGKSRDARMFARRAADAYIQAKEPTKVGDEIEHLHSGARFVVFYVAALDLRPLESGEAEPLTEVAGRQILKSGRLGRMRRLWANYSGEGFRVVGRYAPPEPKP